MKVMGLCRSLPSGGTRTVSCEWMKYVQAGYLVLLEWKLSWDYYRRGLVILGLAK